MTIADTRSPDTHSEIEIDLRKFQTQKLWSSKPLPWIFDEVSCDEDERNSPMFLPSPKTNQGSHDPKSILPDAPGYALIPQDTQNESLPAYKKF